MSAGDRLVLAANLTWGTFAVAAVLTADALGWWAVSFFVVGAALTVGLFVAAFRTLKEKP